MQLHLYCLICMGKGFSWEHIRAPFKMNQPWNGWKMTKIPNLSLSVFFFLFSCLSLSPPHPSPCPCLLYVSLWESLICCIYSDFLSKFKRRDYLNSVGCFILKLPLPNALSGKLNLSVSDRFVHCRCECCSRPSMCLNVQWMRWWPDPGVMPKVSRGKRSEWVMRMPFPH